MTTDPSVEGRTLIGSNFRSVSSRPSLGSADSATQDSPGTPLDSIRPIRFSPSLVSSFGQPILLGGVPADVVSEERALDLIEKFGRGEGSGQLAVASINLDHVYHFGRSERWRNNFSRRPATTDSPGGLTWLNLIDGAPVVKRAERLVGRQVSKLSGSDLIEPVLAVASENNLRVAFLGGTADTHERVRRQWSTQRPEINVVGWWSPERSVLANAVATASLVAEIAAAKVDVLIVGLGKPRQEQWIADHGPGSGARVLLAFGAVIDFLAGNVQRAPRWVSENGMEWVWRLAHEPRRLARRYLVQGPSAYLRVRRDSRLPDSGTDFGSGPRIAPRLNSASFVDESTTARVAALIVAYNSASDLPDLLTDLRAAADRLPIRVVVVDNGSTDGTLDILRSNADVITLSGLGNLGYAGGINAAASHVGDCRTVLVLNPDLGLDFGCIAHLLSRMDAAQAGVVVPRIIDEHGQMYPSLRREPSVRRAMGDALFGSRCANRAAWLSEIEHSALSYQTAHEVDWATGAALLVRADVFVEIGKWQELFFLYSEETDFFRRVRDAGHQVWFEPSAVVRHRQGGSGTSPDLAALMAVNRVRYARLHQPRLNACLFRGAVALSEVMRSYDPVHRLALRAVLDERRWSALPRATPAGEHPADYGRAGINRGAVIIPAHNEASVLAATLDRLAACAAERVLEIVVVCNGCTDETAWVARRTKGVKVVEIDEASKIAAMNAGDAQATLWPRLYLDADIQLPAEAALTVLDRLRDGDLLAARPTAEYDTEGASWLVRAYYRARNRVPSLHASLWGAGVYGLSRAGHDRIGSFPPVTADDLFVDSQFARSEKAVLTTEPALVRTPRRTASLLKVLRRVSRGNAALGTAVPGRGSDSLPRSTATTLRQLLRSIKGPSSLFDAGVYAVFAAVTRGDPDRLEHAWERDLSSRGPRPMPAN